MEAHCSNALQVATFFSTHPFARTVIYLGLVRCHPQREVIRRQVKGRRQWWRPMISLLIKGDRGRFLKHLQLFTLAESLAGVESLVAVPALMSHASLSPERRAELGIEDALIRLSAGLEAADDLIADLDGALVAANTQ